jgi:hypothetical protein
MIRRNSHGDISASDLGMEERGEEKKEEAKEQALSCPTGILSP